MQIRIEKKLARFQWNEVLTLSHSPMYRARIWRSAEIVVVALQAV